MGLFDGFSGSEEGLKNNAFEAIKAELDKQDMKYGEDATEDGAERIIRMRQQLDNGSVVSIAVVVTENGDTNDFSYVWRRIPTRRHFTRSSTSGTVSTAM